MFNFIFKLAIVDDFNNSSDSEIFINDSHNDSEFKCLSKQIESFLSRLNRDQKFRSKLLEELFEKLVNNDNYEDNGVNYEKTGLNDKVNTKQIKDDEDQGIICNKSQNEDYNNNKQKPVLRDDENENDYSMQNDLEFIYPKYHCKFCSKIFQQISSLIQHQRENHQYKFGCGQCKAQFRDEYVFRIHLRKFGCSKRFGIPSLANIELHESENDQTSMPIRNHICQWPGCGKTFTRGSYLSNHMMIHSTERNFICNWSGCDKRYKTQAHLLNHLLVHKQHENYELPCPAMNCTLRFLGESELRQHYYNEHFDEKQEMQKMSRSLTLSSSSSAKVSNEDIPKKPKTITTTKIVEPVVDVGVKYHCDFKNCDYFTTDIMQLQKHEKENHAELLPFKCGHCGTSFKKKSSLSNHVKSHSGEFICSWNECRFRTNSSLILNRHMMSHKDYIINTNPLHEKKFICKLCRKVFTKRASIINHIRSHSGNYSCQWPGCYFASQSKMLFRRHVITSKHNLGDNNNEDILSKNDNGESNTDQSKTIFSKDSSQNEQQLSPFDLMVIGMKKESKMKKKEEQKIKQEIEDEDYEVKVISPSNDKPALKQQSITLNSTIISKNNEDKLNSLQLYHCRYQNCSYQTSKRPLFRVHLLKHSEERKHHCPWAKCGKSFKAKSTLNRHLVRHQRMALSRPSMLMLEDEEEKEEENNGIDIEESIQETKIPKKIKTQPSYEFECDQCGLSFRTKASLSNHRVSHRKPFTCKYPNCYFEAFRITAMERHEKETHGNNELNISIKKVYRCDNNNCDKTFPTLNELNEHSSVHEHRFSCFGAGCKATFSSKADFAEHLQSHHMERKYSTTYICTPNKRVQMDMMDQDERKFKCSYPGCNYSSTMSSTLKKHIYRQHKKPRLTII